MPSADDNDMTWDDHSRVIDGPANGPFDHWGPSHVLQVYDPEADLKGILVIDNTTLGPGLGGIAISPVLSVERVFERARSMTWTCAIMDTGFGGAAACIKGKPNVASKGKLIRAFAKKVGLYVPWLFVATQDLNVGKREMGAFADEVGDWRGTTGKPEYMQGIPYELGVVSFGIGVAIETCLRTTYSWMSSPGGIDGARIALLGYDVAGIALAKYLDRKGAKIVAICDPICTIHNPKGIDIESIPRGSSSTGQRLNLKKCGDDSVQMVKDITKVDCDVLVCTDDHPILRSGNIRRVRARCIVEGAHGLLDRTTCQYFHRNGVQVLPDLLAASGGVISSSAEYHHIGTERAFSMIEAKIREATGSLVAQAHERDLSLRRLAEDAARERITVAMEG